MDGLRNTYPAFRTMVRNAFAERFPDMPEERRNAYADGHAAEMWPDVKRMLFIVHDGDVK